MERERVIVIGAGASGLFFSSLLPDALVLEGKDECGLKLLATGGGKCNITNTWGPLPEGFYEKRNFVSPALLSFEASHMRDYFSSIGVETYRRPDGKVFPLSDDSRTVRDALALKGRISRGEKVIGVERSAEGFLVRTGKRTLLTTFLVVATGGITVPGTGSDGSFFPILSSLGHTIVPPRPALSPLAIGGDVSPLEGISIPSVTIRIGRREECGDIIFTRKGISGPCALDISRFVPEEGADGEISFSPFPPGSIKELEGREKAVRALHEATLLPMRFLTHSLCWGDRKIAELTRNDIASYSSSIWKRKTRFTLENGGKTGMVTKGGVDTAEVDRRTMESRLVPGLHIIGEALDVDGKCGGYNLSFAFASARLAAASIRERLRM